LKGVGTWPPIPLRAIAYENEKYMSFFGTFHGTLVYPRRISQLTRKIADLLPSNARVLDVGCGDGLLASEILKLRPDLRLEGIDILLRTKSFIPIRKFDGFTIPYRDSNFDVVMFVDVLHHTPDPTVLLSEAKRVAQKGIVIKDHTLNGLLAGARLRLMDWIGNAHHGVALPYNYWPEERWQIELEKLGFRISCWNESLQLYPSYADWLFGSSLHFIAHLVPCSSGTSREVPSMQAPAAKRSQYRR